MAYKYIFFTHDDMDGAGCRILWTLMTKSLNVEEYKIVTCTNESVDDDVLAEVEANMVDANTVIHFSDICASRNVLEMIKNKARDIRIFDHHRTNFFAEWVCPNARIVPENTLGQMQSGTSLVYQYIAELQADDPKSPFVWFLDKKYDQTFLSTWVDWIRSYDVYEWKEKGDLDPKKLQTLFSMFGHDGFIEHYLNRFSTPSDELQCHDVIIPAYQDLIRCYLEREKKCAESVEPGMVWSTNLRGHPVAIAMGGFGANVSEVGYNFLTKNDDYDAYIQFSLFKGNGDFSIRAVKDDVDVSKDIALPIGGGGHPKASGASLTPKAVDKMFEIVLDFLTNPEKYQ